MFSEGNFLYSLSQLGYTMLNFFTWCFDFLITPRPIFNNGSILQVAFSSAIAVYFMKAFVDNLWGDIIPGD